MLCSTGILYGNVYNQDVMAADNKLLCLTLEELSRIYIQNDKISNKDGHILATIGPSERCGNLPMASGQARKALPY
jgi:hypothetical protein